MKYKEVETKKNRQRNIMMKNKQISLEVARAWDCFTAEICIMYLY